MYVVNNEIEIAQRYYPTSLNRKKDYTKIRIT